MNHTKVSLEEFLALFPEVELPITLNDEIHHVFSKQNVPVPKVVIEQYFAYLEGEADPEMAEFVACFKIPNTYQFHAIVYWKAELMNYEYVLLTLTKAGEIIDKKVIAGTNSDGRRLTNSVATIDEDWTIYIVSGQSNQSSPNYDPTTSTAFKLELLPEGNIIALEEED